MAPPPPSLKTQVSNLLAKPEVAKIQFSLAGITIDQNSYKQVKTKIDADAITVSYLKTLGANVADYRYTADTLFLGFDVVSTSDREALVVHECTHAALDIAGKAVLVKHSEAAAYVAQCLYYYYANQQAFAVKKPTFGSKVLQAAWDAATLARNAKNGILTMTDIATLLKEIAANPLYKKTADTDAKYDGVP